MSFLRSPNRPAVFGLVIFSLLDAAAVYYFAYFVMSLRDEYRTCSLLSAPFIVASTFLILALAALVLAWIGPHLSVLSRFALVVVPLFSAGPLLLWFIDSFGAFEG